MDWSNTTKRIRDVRSHLDNAAPIAWEAKRVVIVRGTGACIYDGVFHWYLKGGSME